MNTTILAMDTERTIKIWVLWSEEYIANSYEDAVNFSQKCGMIADFSDWLRYYADYEIEDIFEMDENEKIKVRAEYDEYVENEISDQWEEKEITIITI